MAGGFSICSEAYALQAEYVHSKYRVKYRRYK